MPPVSDLQKLENLLNSATSARQRKMYQALLEKARKDSGTETQKIVSIEKAETDTTIKTTAPTKEKQQKCSTKKAKEKTKALRDSDRQKIVSVQKVEAPAPARETSPAKQKQQKLSTEKAKEEIKTPEVETAKKSESKKSPIEENASIPQEILQTKKNDQKSQKKVQDVFQAVGWVKCIPQIKDEKLYIAIDSKQYQLRRGKFGARKHFDNLKLELEQNASRELWLRVYPRIAHLPGKEKIDFWFSLTKVLSDDTVTENPQKYFILRGIWHYVPHCSEPVISIYRNIDMLRSYKRISSHAAKKAFARSQDFPVVWNAPVEPFRYNPKLEKSEQMPRYFVQVKAVFMGGKFEVTEVIKEPTLDIPKYINPPKKVKSKAN